MSMEGMWPDPSVGQVLEWYTTDWGDKIPVRIAIGYALNPKDRVIYTVPKSKIPKRKEDCINWDKPEKDQKWRRFKEMPEWSWQSVRNRATDFPMGYGKYDLRWFDKDENLTQEMIDYREADWERRVNGIFIYIKGQLFYFTGRMYMFLQWAKMNKTVRPDFRERDLLWWYWWQAIIEDMFCYGGVYLKHRRDGFTNRAMLEQLDTVSLTAGAVGTITSSYDKDHALETIWPEIFLPLLKAWPPYFIPDTVNGIDQPVGGVITFGKQKRKGDARLHDTDDEFIERTIKVAGADKEKSKGDGGKIKRAFWDETGKEQKRVIQKVLNTMKPALTQGGVYGKILTGSTVEESENGMSLQFADLCKRSMPSQRQPDGFTESGLYFLFFPCWFCLDEDYIDEWGFSISDAPKPHDIEYQKRRQWGKIFETVGHDEEKANAQWEIIKSQKYSRGGSKMWVRDYRSSASDPVELAQRKRLYPETPDDALLPSAKESYFDQMILTDALRDCESPDANGDPIWRGMTRIGRFEWAETWVPTEGQFKGIPQPKFGGEVKWVDYPEGHEKARFTIQKKMLLNDIYCPYQPNRVVRTPSKRGDRPFGTIRPTDYMRDGTSAVLNPHKFKIGVDPFEWDKRRTAERSRDLSKAGAWCKWVFDPDVDGGSSEDTAEAIESQRSNSYMWVYHARPLNANEFHEDMLMACIYFGTPLNVEKDRSSSFQQWFEDHGCLSFIMPDQLALANDSDATTHDPKKGTRANHDVGFPLLSAYVSTHIRYTHKFPFPKGIRQLLTVTLETIGQHDLVAAMEQTEMCRVKKDIRGLSVAASGQNVQIANKSGAGRSRGTLALHRMSSI